MFLQHVIGADLQATAQLLDETNRKASKVLEKFQQAWKESQKKVVDWSSFLEFTGCSEALRRQITRDQNKWVHTCVARAKARGKMYGF